MSDVRAWVVADDAWFGRALNFLTSQPAVILASGCLAGLAAFLFGRQEFAPLSGPWSGLLIAGAGGIPPVYVKSLRASFRVAITAYLLAVLVMALAWIAPWFLNGYGTEAIQLLMFRYFGAVALHALLTLFPIYFIGYLTLVSLIGIFLPSA